jgi:coproporphyrinogen III oxidase
VKVLPYVKIAKQLHAELVAEKENSKKRQYKKYRKDVEKEMRAKFEKELKNLTQGQGEMLFKLINRETGNNSYNLIKDIKGGFQAGILQLLAKRWGYNLKDKYDPNQEKMIELIIKELGPAYNVKS